MAYYWKQMNAAYIPDDIWNIILKFTHEEKIAIKKLYAYAGRFECITNFKSRGLGENSRQRILAMIAQNILHRGIPTLAPAIIEKQIKNKEKKAKDVKNDFTYENIASAIAKTTINEDLLKYPEKKFYKERRYYQKNADGTISAAEVNHTEVGFLVNQIATDPELSYLAQYMEFQKLFEHVVTYPNTEAQNYTNYTRYVLDYSLPQIIEVVREQRLDLTLELPQLQNGGSCVDLELDGPTHEEAAQKSSDKMRDDILHELYWQNTIRVPVSEINDRKRYAGALKNTAAPLHKLIINKSSIDKDIIQFPVSVAKVARTFLYLVESGDLAVLSGKNVAIAIDEYTDKEAILMGVQNACNLLSNLYDLLNGSSRAHKQGMANIYLVFPPGKGNWKNEVYKVNPDGNEPVLTEMRLPELMVQLHIAECLNHRLYAFNPKAFRKHKVWLYNAYGKDAADPFQFGRALTYNITEENMDNLKYFLYDIFRKKDFRPKQMDIIAAALSRKNVIGLLPTGSGKTLTYQMSILLQAGIGLVIAPLVSLMQDQVINLRSCSIDVCATINGMQTGADKRLLLRDISQYEYLFVYIAPERLQIPEFKKLLKTLPVSTVVVDEAHCVSQWGHDFRTAYLRVGNTLKDCLNDYITMALTGTASCNVITDIKRELNMSKNVVIVTPNNFRRPELHFKILEQDTDMPLDERIQKGIIEAAIKEAIQCIAKENDFQNVEDGTEKQFFRKENGEYVNSGLIFVPFAVKKDSSVESIYQRLSNEAKKKGITVGMYHGQLDNQPKKKEQTDFKENKTGLLVATKAFGMGIDKPNIRFTIHTTIPESIESFYQEAGRAGRDRKDAVNIILAPPSTIDYAEINDKGIYDYFLNQSFPDKEALENKVLELMDTGFVTEDTMEQSVLDPFKDMDMSADDIHLRINKKTNELELQLSYNKKRENYRIHFDNQKKVSVQPLLRSTKKDFMQKKYEEEITDKIAKRLESYNNLNVEKLVSIFSVQKSSLCQSIADTLRSLKEQETRQCYVGLDHSFLINWIEMILRALIERKRIETKRENAFLILSQETIYEIKNAQKKAAREKWKYPVNEFYKTYQKICRENRMTPLSLVRYMKEAEDVKPNWKGGANSSQDKALYYLGLLGIYTDFERCYSPDYAKIRLKAVDREDLKEHIRDFISSYETSDYVRRKVNLDWLDHIEDSAELVANALKYVIDYSYDKIRTYRMVQGENMYKCIQANNDRNEDAFTDEVYKYFESKYSDQMLKDIEHENLRLPMKWINMIEEKAESGEENLLEDLSHLRTSALKVEEARPQAFTPYLLYAYATLRDHNLDIRSGLNAYLTGKEHMKGLRQNYKAPLQRICQRMMDTEDLIYLQEVKKIIEKEYMKKDIGDIYNLVDEKLKVLSDRSVEEN